MSEQRLEDVAPEAAAPPPDVPAPEPPSTAEPAPSTGGDELERVLAEFDQGISKTSAPAPAAAEPPPAPVDPLQEQQDLAARDRELVDAGERAFQEAYARELSLQQERLSFNQECDRIQAMLPDHIPEGYVKAALLAASIEDPRLEIAWQARNINPAELRAELQRVTVQFMQLRSNPTADPQQIEQLRQWGAQLEVAVDARRILKQAELRLVNEAKKSKRPIDPDATADRLMVAQAVRGQSTSSLPAEPPPNLGQMDDNEFRRFKLQFGFE